MTHSPGGATPRDQSLAPGPDQPRRLTLGEYGERLAEQHLRELGADILARNHRDAFGELDLIVRHEGDLVGVEVKTRLIGGPEQPEESISGRKLARLVRLLTAYAVTHGYADCGWRIDAVAVEVEPDGTTARIEHIPNAYEG